MEQDFEKMEVVKFQWRIRDICLRRTVSLKEACYNRAVAWIVLAVITLLLGALGSFLLGGLRSHNITYYGLPEDRIAMAVGVGSLVDGILLLVYSIILLNKVGDNGAPEVFKTIKVGCLIFLYLELIENFLLCVFFVVLLQPPYSLYMSPDSPSLSTQSI